MGGKDREQQVKVGSVPNMSETNNQTQPQKPMDSHHHGL